MRKTRPPGYRGEFEPVTFRVIGVPAPKGSKNLAHRKDGTAFMYDQAGKDLTKWKRMLMPAVKLEAASLACAPLPLDGPLRVLLTFFMPGKIEGAWHCVAPDKDKLTRAVLDSLKDGGLIWDDSRICSFAVEGVQVVQSAPGCQIVIRRALARRL